jgi:hypothetical protein
MIYHNLKPNHMCQPRTHLHSNIHWLILQVCLEMYCEDYEEFMQRCPS